MNEVGLWGHFNGLFRAHKKCENGLKHLSVILCSKFACLWHLPSFALLFSLVLRNEEIKRIIKNGNADVARQGEKLFLYTVGGNSALLSIA